PFLYRCQAGNRAASGIPFFPGRPLFFAGLKIFLDKKFFPVNPEKTRETGAIFSEWRRMVR
ncbi:MAG: hypothetical protein LBB83_04490, partial [Treponema sp.]|nr:hypothetical protein [Treponema sp.]